MVGTQPPLNSNKWWHLKKVQEKSQCFIFLLFFKFILRFKKNVGGKNKPHLTRLLYHVAQKIKHTHTLSALLLVHNSKHLSPCFSFHPSPLQSCYPLPFALMLTDSADIPWAGDRYVISWGETGLSSAGECASPSSSEETDTHDTFPHSLPDSTLACRQNQRGHLSHAIRVESKDDEVRCTKESWGSEGCNERWLEIEA